MQSEELSKGLSVGLSVDCIMGSVGEMTDEDGQSATGKLGDSDSMIWTFGDE